MTITQHDFVVIGSGPAGRRAAIQAAKLGRSVLVLEKGRRVGGVSVHTGTIPSKTLRETVLNLTGWRERGFYGRAYRAKKDITAADLRKRLHITLDHEVEGLEHQFARNTVDTVIGAARFLFELMAARGITLQPGQWISSGAVTGVHEARPGQRIETRFDGQYVVSCSLVAAARD